MKLRIKNFKLNVKALTIKAKETTDTDTRRVEGLPEPTKQSKQIIRYRHEDFNLKHISGFRCCQLIFSPSLPAESQAIVRQ